MKRPGDSHMSPGGIDSRTGYEEMQKQPSGILIDPADVNYGPADLRPVFTPGMDPLYLRKDHFLLSPRGGVG